MTRKIFLGFIVLTFLLVTACSDVTTSSSEYSAIPDNTPKEHPESSQNTSNGDIDISDIDLEPVPDPGTPTIIKVPVESSEESVEIKEEKFNDKSYTLYYDESFNKSGTGEKRSDIFKTSDESVMACYDAATGELCTLYIDSEWKKTDDKISRKEAEEIGNKFIKNYNDLSGYQLTTFTAENDGYDIIYDVYIEGFAIGQRISVTVDYSGDVIYFNQVLNNPFEYIKVPPIDTKALLASIEKVAKNDGKDKYLYHEIVDMHLIVDGGEPAMFVGIFIYLKPEMQEMGKLVYHNLGYIYSFSLNKVNGEYKGERTNMGYN